MSKILINLNVPTIEKKYNLWIPDNNTVYETIKLMVKGINDLNYGQYNPRRTPLLFNKSTGVQYNYNLTVKEANIKNGTELILV